MVAGKLIDWVVHPSRYQPSTMGASNSLNFQLAKDIKQHLSCDGELDPQMKELVETSDRLESSISRMFFLKGHQ